MFRLQFTCSIILFLLSLKLEFTVVIQVIHHSYTGSNDDDYVQKSITSLSALCENGSMDICRQCAQSNIRATVSVFI